MRDFIQTLLGNVSNFLNSIQFQEIFLLLTILLLGVGCLARLVSNCMTLFTPSRFGKEHRGALHHTANVCYWMSVIAQLLFWLFGSASQRATLRDADFLAALILAGLAVLSLLLSVLMMIFPRKGTRVFVNRNLSHAALIMLLLALLLVVISWLLLSEGKGV